MSHAPDPKVLRSRLDAARDAAARTGVDAVLVTPGPDLRYLAGYLAIPLERLTCLLVPAAGEPTLVVPRLEQAAAEASGAGDVVRIVSHQETDDAFAMAAGLLRDAIGGVPSTVALTNSMPALHVLRLRDAMPDTRQVLAGGVLGELRLRKAPDEVDALRRAAQAIDRVHARMGEWLRPGRTEAEVGRDIAEAIVAWGHRSVNFVIVGSGPNGASPHHDTSDRVIERGDPVVVDIGGTMPDGYCSDCTRTYVAGGEPDPEFAKYYAVLLDAQKRSCDAVRPGVTAESVDAAARDVIAEAGYGELFIHRTGHGIGLEEHEDPYIVAGNSTTLEPGMCFSIEPGIYLPGRHGARIEDIVAVTDVGVERLDTIDRELVVLD
ncbi:MAG TPA: Xaa-Pro peptidase family protein [Mycobacteriales bacterium]|nr:Xaa-Pro peptidase family protein [Mycobacteriales bacterium]